MELLLNVKPNRSANGQHLVAVVSQEHTVANLTEALRRYLTVDSTLALYRDGQGSAFPLDQKVLSTGVVSGCTLYFADKPSADISSSLLKQRNHITDTATVNLKVVAGPDQGLIRTLTTGEYTLGRFEEHTTEPPNHIYLKDPRVSRTHLDLRITIDGSVFISERPDVTNPVELNENTCETSFAMVEGDVLSVGSSKIEIQPWQTLENASRDQLGQVAFSRTPFRPARPHEVELPALRSVPSPPDPVRFAFLTILAPLVGAVMMASLIGEPRFLLFGLLSPIIGVGTFIERKMTTGKRHKEAVERFKKDVTKREESIKTTVEKEWQVRRLGAPDLATLADWGSQRKPGLWRRGRDLPEFLRLRLGVGELSSAIRFAPDPSGDDNEYQQIADNITDTASTIHQTPVSVELIKTPILGIHGENTALSSIVSSLALQAVCLHSPDSLIVAGGVSPELGIGQWLKWMPHTRYVGSPLSGSHLALAAQTTNELLAKVAEVAEYRLASNDTGFDHRWPWILLFIDSRTTPDPVLSARLLRQVKQAGISVIWTSPTFDDLPPECSAVLGIEDLRESEYSTLWFTDPEVENIPVIVDGVHTELPAKVALSLAPLRDASSASATASIPREVTLFAAHDIDDVNPEWIKEQWSIDRGYTLQSVLGRSSNGPVSLDLVDQGPHGLVGGTSGSGKSELVQSLVIGLAVAHAPEELSLLFVDFKGGSLAKVFEGLPHIVGSVTDLNEALARRAQTSIRAELKRRQTLFSSLGVKDLEELRSKSLKDAPPSLVIVIDEFATLKKELPDFVADIIDISQRGRSYGIHLLLATQRPSTSVDDNILANTNLRISLRMLDSAESNAIINSPEAAGIPVPLKGRALARFGPRKLVEFQSAYANAPYNPSSGLPPIQVAPFDPETDITKIKPQMEDTLSEVTQIEQMVTAINAVGHPTNEQVWTPLLPALLPLSEINSTDEKIKVERTAGTQIVLGMFDDPSKQAQYAAEIDLEETGGLLITGVGSSGKSTALVTAVTSACIDDSRNRENSLVFFAFDFASGALTELRDLPQCGNVIDRDDLEAASRIIGLLDGEIARRRAVGVRSSNPKILVVIDDYINLVEALSSRYGQESKTNAWAEALQRVVTDGRQVGVHCIITASRVAALPRRVKSALTGRLILRHIDDMEPKEAGYPSTALFKPGAGFLLGRQIQIASLFTENSWGTLQNLAKKLTGTVPLSLQSIPLDTQYSYQPTGAEEPFTGFVGIADTTNKPVAFNIKKGDLLVVGPPESGRSNALLAIGNQLVSSGAEVYALGAGESLLQRGNWKLEAYDPTAVAQVLETAAAEPRDPNNPLILLIDDADLVLPEDMQWNNLGKPFAPENQGVRLIASYLGKPPGYSGSALVTRVKNASQMLSLQPQNARSVAELVGIDYLPPLRLGLKMPQGRGVWVSRRKPTVVQVFDEVSLRSNIGGT